MASEPDSDASEHAGETTEPDDETSELDDEEAGKEGREHARAGESTREWEGNQYSAKTPEGRFQGRETRSNGPPTWVGGGGTKRRVSYMEKCTVGSISIKIDIPVIAI